MTLSYLTSLCEAYFGVWPTVEIFRDFFYLKAQKRAGGDLVDCGTAAISRCKSDIPELATLESARKWQHSWFYVKKQDEP